MNRYDNKATERLARELQTRPSEPLWTFYFAGLDGYCHRMYEETAKGVKPDVRTCQLEYLRSHIDPQLASIRAALGEADPNWHTNTLLALTSDHGMTDVHAAPESLFGSEVDLREKLADVLESGFCIGDCDDDPMDRRVALGINGGMAEVYVRRANSEWGAAPDVDADLKPLARKILRKGKLRKTVEAVLVRPAGWGSGYRRARLESGAVVLDGDSGYDSRRDTLVQRLDSPRSGDVVVVLKEHQYFEPREDYPANHGGLAESDLHVPLVLAGPGVVKEFVDEEVSNTQVLATIVRALGEQELPPDVDMPLPLGEQR